MRKRICTLTVFLALIGIAVEGWRIHIPAYYETAVNFLLGGHSAVGSEPLIIVLVICLIMVLVGGAALSLAVWSLLCLVRSVWELASFICEVLNEVVKGRSDNDF